MLLCASLWAHRGQTESVCVRRVQGGAGKVGGSASKTGAQWAATKSRSMQLVCHQIGWRHVTFVAPGWFGVRPGLVEGLLGLEDLDGPGEANSAPVSAELLVLSRDARVWGSRPHCAVHLCTLSTTATLIGAFISEHLACCRGSRTDLHPCDWEFLSASSRAGQDGPGGAKVGAWLWAPRWPLEERDGKLHDLIDMLRKNVYYKVQVADCVPEWVKAVLEWEWWVMLSSVDLWSCCKVHPCLSVMLIGIRFACRGIRLYRPATIVRLPLQETRGQVASTGLGLL